MGRGGVRIAAISVCLGTYLFADGGAVQFRRQAGSLVMTVFAAPSPVRAGAATDLTVLVQDSRDLRPVLNAEVALTLSKAGGQDVVVSATRAQAVNKLLYAASAVLPVPGEWRVNVQIIRQHSLVSVDGTINVLPAESSVARYWPYIAIVPFLIVLFVLNQWLKSRSHPHGRSAA